MCDGRRVPYVLFRTRSGVYGIDGYFYPALERVEHRAALPRKMPPKPVPRAYGDSYVTSSNVGKVLRELALELYELTGRSFGKSCAPLSSLPSHSGSKLRKA